MVEMQEAAAILRSATTSSLVLLDEIGRGTSTFDGLSIAWSVAEHLHDVVRCKVMFATHYHELVDLARTREHVANYNVAAERAGDEIVFLRKLVPGGSSRSYGIDVARLAGVPESVLGRARQILERLERDAPAPSGRTSPIDASPQLDLFASEQHRSEAEDLLSRLEVERMTPLEALSLLARLKEMVLSGRRG
jgi:DNA mismatch repair protein MutS